MSENEIQKFILNYLQVMGRGYFWRNNTVGVFDPVKKFYRKNPSQEKGVADILGVIDGRFIAIECKASGFNKLREDQKKFKQKFEKSGGIFYLANNIDEFINWFNLIKNGKPPNLSMISLKTKNWA